MEPIDQMFSNGDSDSNNEEDVSYDMTNETELKKFYFMDPNIGDENPTERQQQCVSLDEGTGRFSFRMSEVDANDKNGVLAFNDVTLSNEDSETDLKSFHGMNEEQFKFAAYRLDDGNGDDDGCHRRIEQGAAEEEAGFFPSTVIYVDSVCLVECREGPPSTRVDVEFVDCLEQ